ncbi:MAG: SH3 domain-containing protein [Clostridia bacterium]|nr:SH3 domain-containing protein [Clostridia bacterium]
MKKAVLLTLLVLLLAHPALADENAFCDPVPESLREALSGPTSDCIVFELPDGGRHVYTANEYGWLSGYSWQDGQWQSNASGITLGEENRVYLRRHDPGKPRPDGTSYADSLGFDFFSPTGAYESYHYDGQWFSLDGFADPARYNGAVMIQDSVIAYYPAGSTEPAYRFDAGTREKAYSFLYDFDSYPMTPAEGKRIAALLPAAIREDFPGYTLVSHRLYDSNGPRASATFARVADDGQGPVLQVIQAAYSGEQGLEKTVALLDIPLSARLASMPADELWNNYYDIFREPGALDETRISIDGKVVDLAPQQEQLILLTEDAKGDRRVTGVYPDVLGRYFQQTTHVLPPQTSMDTFHAGEGQIYLDMAGQSWSLYYHKTAPYEWKLTGGRVSNDAESFDYSVNRFGVTFWMPDETVRLYGTLRADDLFEADFLAYPQTLEGIKGAVDSSGWAVVNNPNPADRLNLRTQAATSADSYGKFYNGTPVRVLDTRGDWCQVLIGKDGLTGWMVRKYLAFDTRASAVEPAFPWLMVKEGYEDQDIPGWAERTRKTPSTMPQSVDWVIIGVADDLYILLNRTDGNLMYAPMDYFWEGNG